MPSPIIFGLAAVAYMIVSAGFMAVLSITRNDDPEQRPIPQRVAARKDREPRG